jgi:hypothetical protein
MMKRCLLFIVFICYHILLFAQKDSIVSFKFRNDVTITIDYPKNFSSKKATQLIFFALPNGNTTAQTMGKKMKVGDDWHFDIQHIAAQTKFIRAANTKENIIVAYVENNAKAWPLWKRNHSNYLELIPKMIDTVSKVLQLKNYYVHLNSHSGGGSFIFGYLESQQQIPNNIQRISFLDSDYGYDSSYTQKIIAWLQSSKQHHLTVFAYNDSVVIFNGKPLVSPTGGTWYRSKLMMKDLSSPFNFTLVRNDSVQQFSANKNRINFFLVDNPEKKIYHTVQVERNGFIHSVLIGTKYENKNYLYWSKRAYENFIVE